ncbi:MAG: YqgE/AlgH family protein [Dehalococcoidia bacterium]
MFESTAGRLLVATPLLDDPNFDGAVVFVCLHDAAGAFGIVLNRAAEGQAADLLPEWASLISPPGVLHSGGPVERSSFIGVGRMDDGLTVESPSEWWTPIRHGIGLVNLAADVDQALALQNLRVFHGYTGWGAGQLDTEIGEEAWFVVDARPEDVFTLNPGRLWNEVLGRQRGRLAIYGTYPPDVQLN